MYTVDICCVCAAPIRFLLLRFGGRISNVTPGGIERGDLPIFEARCGEKVKVLREEKERHREAIARRELPSGWVAYVLNAHSRQRHRVLGSIVVMLMCCGFSNLRERGALPEP